MDSATRKQWYRLIPLVFGLACIYMFMLHVVHDLTSTLTEDEQVTLNKLSERIKGYKDEVTLDKLTEWLPEARQEARQQRLQRVCRAKYGDKTNIPAGALEGVLNYQILDRNHNVLYCNVPKVASSSLKLALVNLTRKFDFGEDPSKFDIHGFYDKTNAIAKIGISKLNSMEKAAAVSILDSAKSFMFVRHPLKRILAAYNDKFTIHSPVHETFQKRFGKYIIQKFRPNATAEEIKWGADVRFPEFVKYLIDVHQTGGFFQEHWRPYNDLCAPCRVQYNFIGQMETMNTDARYVIEHLFEEPGAGVIPSLNHKWYSKSLLEFYQEVSKEDMLKLYNVYDMDFEIFGYDREIPDS